MLRKFRYSKCNTVPAAKQLQTFRWFYYLRNVGDYLPIGWRKSPEEWNVQHRRRHNFKSCMVRKLLGSCHKEIKIRWRYFIIEYGTEARRIKTA